MIVFVWSLFIWCFVSVDLFFLIFQPDIHNTHSHKTRLYFYIFYTHRKHSHVTETTQTKIVFFLLFSILFLLQTINNSIRASSNLLKRGNETVVIHQLMLYTNFQTQNNIYILKKLLKSVGKNEWQEKIFFLCINFFFTTLLYCYYFFFLLLFVSLWQSSFKKNLLFGSLCTHRCRNFFFVTVNNFFDIFFFVCCLN